MQKTRVRSLGQEDPLQEEMTAHSSILAWKIPWTEKPGRPQSMGSQSKTGLSVNTKTCMHTHTHQIFVECLPQARSLLPQARLYRQCLS